MRATDRMKGFTLVEALVALAILGAVAGAALVIVGQNARYLATAEDRAVAAVLLDNLMVDALARAEPLDRSETEEEIGFANRRWLVRRAVIETDVPGLVRVEIAVRDRAGRTLADAATLKAEGR